MLFGFIRYCCGKDTLEAEARNSLENLEAGTANLSEPLTAQIQTHNEEQSSSKTLLENFWYNALMTFMQDLPQTIATVIVMAKGQLEDNPDNPTGVSLPGKLDLIPQIGNTTAGIAAAHEANRLIHNCRRYPSKDNLLNACLYTIFSISTILNGSINFFRIFDTEENEIADSLSTISTFVALSSNFLILCREEKVLLSKLCCPSSEEAIDRDKGNDIFHIICSFNLNLSIISAFLATLGTISRNLGAYGYIWGTWLGQVPELIPPLKEKITCQKTKPIL